MIGKVLMELLQEAYAEVDANRATEEQYKFVGKLITEKSDKLLDAGLITQEEWDDIYEEHGQNILVLGDVVIPD